ncbi:hypothetical protein [Rhizobium sp. MHM7A]|uniref:hypothetical protein n=1 Tax=Rhizobium sp. MHM7A TaxID=2583233 RepID=UPI0011073C90|nr:hypothetical protein [Rhizobium sp. MHM7A]TLX16439.1 hypothetical protein FFR93_03640 [Rhizobium sp. MHM7A]
MTSIRQLADIPASVGQCEQLTGLQVAAGLVTWTNVLMVFALIVGTVSFVFLFGRAVLRLLAIFKVIPVAVYEAGGYALSAALLAAPSIFDISDSKTWFLVPGALLLAGLLLLTAKLHKLKENPPRYFLTLTILWGAMAYYHQEPILGFATVAAFMAFMGFSIIITPLAYFIGFEDEKTMSRAGGAGLLISALLVFERLFTPGIPQLDIFRTGMLWLGPFVFALSMLIRANRWMITEKQSWLGMQLMAFGAFFMLMSAGANLQIEAMLNVGTGFMILYVLEKPLEIKQRSLTTLAFTGLLLSILVGAFVYWTQQNPETIQQYLPLLAK